MPSLNPYDRCSVRAHLCTCARAGHWRWAGAGKGAHLSIVRVVTEHAGGSRSQVQCHLPQAVGAVRGSEGRGQSDAAPSSEPRPGAASPGERAARTKAGDLHGPRLVLPA